MYDRTLDVFAPHAPPSPMSLWPSRATLPTLRSSLGEAPGQWVSSKKWGEVPSGSPVSGDRIKVVGGYGIGGPGLRRYYAHGLGGLGTAEAESYEGDTIARNATTAAAPAPIVGLMKRVATKAEKAESNDKLDSLKDEEKKPGEKGRDAAAAVPLRANFSETAFWQPQLLTGPDGIREHRVHRPRLGDVVERVGPRRLEDAALAAR